MRSSALVAACHSKACAPPPAGKGGSIKGSALASKVEKVAGEPVKVNYEWNNKLRNFRVSISTVGKPGDPRFQKPGQALPGTVKPIANMSWHKETGRIEGLLVEKPFQRKGIATALFNDATEQAKLRGVAAPQHSEKLTTDGSAWRKSLVAACYDAACRPPTSGGTGGSSRGAVQHSGVRFNPKNGKPVLVGIYDFRPSEGSGKAIKSSSPPGRYLLSAQSRAKAAKARGSASTNTSMYPVDTHSVTKPSDVNPKAPGHNNRAAVRGHKGVHGTDPERRIPHMGETVDIYRDLGKGKEHKRGFPDNDAFSVRPASGSPGNRVGEVVASTVAVVLTNGRPAWSHSSKQEAEVAGKRGVHGFIRGEVREFASPAVLEARVKSDPAYHKVTYYPGTQDFFMPGSRHRFVGAEEVILVKGEFFAKNPLTLPIPTPVSPIEKRLGLVASAGIRNALIAACHSPQCAPPPAGVGGSCGPGGCVSLVHPRRAVGVMGRGTQTTRLGAARFCSGKALKDGLCGRHLAVRDRQQAALERRRALRAAKG